MLCHLLYPLFYLVEAHHGYQAAGKSHEDHTKDVIKGEGDGIELIEAGSAAAADDQSCNQGNYIVGQVDFIRNKVFDAFRYQTADYGKAGQQG